MTRRNPRRCFDCGTEWYPKNGGDILRCPDCFSKRVGVRREFHKVNRTMRNFGVFFSILGGVLWFSSGLGVGTGLLWFGLALWYFCGTDMYTWY